MKETKHLLLIIAATTAINTFAHAQPDYECLAHEVNEVFELDIDFNDPRPANEELRVRFADVGFFELHDMLSEIAERRESDRLGQITRTEDLSKTFLTYILRCSSDREVWERICTIDFTFDSDLRLESVRCMVMGEPIEINCCPED